MNISLSERRKAEGGAWKGEVFYATGKRKNAIAKVWIKLGSGEAVINGRKMDDYFVRESLISDIYSPFTHVSMQGQFDIRCITLGGGVSGQAGALRLGISRALTVFDETDFRPKLKAAGLLTRDSRVVERKKCGKKKARKSPQFSKR